MLGRHRCCGAARAVFRARGDREGAGIPGRNPAAAGPATPEKTLTPAGRSFGGRRDCSPPRRVHRAAWLAGVVLDRCGRAGPARRAGQGLLLPCAVGKCATGPRSCRSGEAASGRVVTACREITGYPAERTGLGLPPGGHSRGPDGARDGPAADCHPRRWQGPRTPHEAGADPRRWQGPQTPDEAGADPRRICRDAAPPHGRDRTARAG